MDCTACGTKLNSSRWSKDGSLKACPHCSDAHGSQHVYSNYPDAFGETDARITSRNKLGSQSYCVNCRGRNPPNLDKAILCGSLATTSKPPNG